jgi:ribosomal protein S18 acetylase RimI-like enzyme
MTDAELLEAADLNYIEFQRDSARAARGGHVVDEDGLCFFVPEHRFPFGFTGVMRTDASVAAEDAVRRSREFFAARDQGCTHVLMEHRDADLAAVLEAEGVSAMGQSPGMVLEQRLEDRPAPEGTTIDRVATEADVRDFAEVRAVAYKSLGMPEAVGRRHFTEPRTLLAPHIHAFVARIDGAPAAAAMCSLSHGVSGIYWVGTMPAARGRGLAEAVTRVATNAGFDHGARFAALQASVMGEPIYLRMGYRPITRYPWYVVMP